MGIALHISSFMRPLRYRAIMQRALPHLQEGELLEMGSHPELIAKRGVYSEMWARQVSRGSMRPCYRNACTLTCMAIKNRRTMSESRDVSNVQRANVVASFCVCQLTQMLADTNAS